MALFSFFPPAAFLFYAAVVIIAIFILIFHYVPQYGQTHILFYVGVCSLVGSLSVRTTDTLLKTMKVFSYCFPRIFLFIRFCVTGYECQSNWDCFEADSIRNEPTYISTDVVLYFGGGCLCDYPNELFK